MRYSKYIVAGAVLLSMAVGTQTVQAADAARGKDVYYKYGCESCHGWEGQGGFAGKRLAPQPMNMIEFMQYVRDPSGVMPGYTKKQGLTDADIQDMYAYLAARPKAASMDVLKKLGIVP